MADNKLEIILTAKDEASPTIKKVGEEISKTSDKASASNDGLIKGLKNQMQPMRDIIQTVTRVGLIWGATFGVMIKGVLDLGKEIDKLDKLSAQLGISTSDLSKRFYGFDISTQEARTGVAALQNMIGSFGNALMWLKVKIGETVAENDIAIKQYGVLGSVIAHAGVLGAAVATQFSPKMSREEAIKAIEAENLAKRTASAEGQALMIAEHEIFNKLSLSKVELARVTFSEQLTMMRKFGIDTTNIQREFDKQALSDRKIMLMQLAADRAEAEGHTTEALAWNQNIQMESYRRHTNDKTVLNTLAANQEIAMVKKVQEANMRNYKAVADGLAMVSNAMTAYAGENKKAAKAAAALSLAMAIVYTAMGVAKAFSDYSWPYSIIVGALVLAAGAVQIATISAQSFHKGGVVRHEGGLADDEVPATLQTGEGVVNRTGMSVLGTLGLNRLNAGNNSTPSYKTDIYIEINNPSVRNDDDIDKLTEEISMKLAREVQRL